MPGSDGSLDDADAVALRPLLLDPVVLQAGTDRREGRRRARQSREEHDWKQVVDHMGTQNVTWSVGRVPIG